MSKRILYRAAIVWILTTILLGGTHSHAQSSGAGSALLLGLFGGVTRQAESQFSTYGLFYEYRTGFLGGSLALGALYDQVSDQSAQRLILLLNTYISTDLHLGVGAGVKSLSGETKNVYHFEAGHSFHSDVFVLQPMLAYELIGGDTNTIFGLRFLMGF